MDTEACKGPVLLARCLLEETDGLASRVSGRRPAVARHIDAMSKYQAPVWRLPIFNQTICDALVERMTTTGMVSLSLEIQSPPRDYR